LLQKQNENPLFFIVVNPGFEKLAAYELARALQALQFEWNGDYVSHSGGLELRLPINVGLFLNQLLRIPTRILLRLGTKKDLLLYQDFQKWLRTLEVEKYFPLKQVSVSTRSSKLKMKDKLKNVFLNTFQFKTSPEGSDIYIRFFRDECTVSLDTSGADLYQRGQEKWTGVAPLRDTMAAALLQLALQGVEDIQNWQIVDPMMGSGTFLAEAAQYAQPLERAFAYEKWFTGEKPRLEKVQNALPAIWGADIDKKNIELAQKNLTIYKIPDLQLRQEDFFKGTVEKKNKQRLVILNPPYGKRIKIDRENFYNQLLQKIVERFDPDRIGVIVPRGKKIIKPNDYEQVRYLEFSNNSIDVHFHLFLKIKNPLL
jgi:putative N6-adenine-specific DNA methylase